MRTLFLIAVAAACVAIPAYGQQADTSVQVPGAQPSRYRMDAQDFKNFSGRYLLSNGKEMRMWRANKQLYAQVDDEPRRELIPVARNVFVVRATGARITFDLMYGNITGELAIHQAPQPGLLLGAR